MAKSKLGKKRNRGKKINLCFALKSQNEVYYQMASIFKQAGKGEDELAKKIFTRVLTGNQSKISLENSW